MISEEEAALYDRQIRLWGADAQKRLRVARLLAWWGSAATAAPYHQHLLGAELCKNALLAGLAHVTIVGPSDSASHTVPHLFLRDDDDPHQSVNTPKQFIFLPPFCLIYSVPGFSLGGLVGSSGRAPEGFGRARF